MPASLFVIFAISTVMVLVTVAIHGLGLAVLSYVLRQEAMEERQQQIAHLSLRGALFTLGVVLALVSLHGIEIWVYALVYIVIDAVPDLTDALYYSTMSYSTVGFDDDPIVHAWRLLGAFESILGMIMLGWSTAFFWRMLSRLEVR